MVEPERNPELRAQLERWVAAGLIGPEQAQRIEHAEQTRRNARRDRAGAGVAWVVGRGRAALIAEALGYLGSLLTIVAVLTAVDQLWPDAPPGMRAAAAGLASVLLGLSAGLLRPRGDAALGRLRSVLWFLSVAALAACGGELGAVWHLSDSGTVMLASGPATAYAIVLWLRTKAPLQHIAMFGGLATALGAGVVRIDPDTPLWVSGLSVWLLSVVWAVAVYRGHVPPAAVGLPVAAVGSLIGAQLMMETAAGHVVALATVAGVLAAGVVLRRMWVLAAGALGVLLTVPRTADRYFPDSVAAPLTVLLVGAVLLGVSVFLLRRAVTGRPRAHH
ncbi:DUF2157 domain-containing protein [Streptomyces sp. NPDC002825]|uniref:DUF2157 domain-containing protein n=1 Tax=Streptomyces sp. NPDC002825 TaxID=3154666 RepID=UPI0033210A0C